MLVASSSNDPDNTIQSVAFYVGTSSAGIGYGAVSLGAGTDAADGWAADVSSGQIDSAASTFAGSTLVFYAQATDAAGLEQPAVSLSYNYNPLVIGQLTAGSDLYTTISGSSLTLTASGILDRTSGSGSSVMFYQDLSGTGIYYANSVRAIERRYGSDRQRRLGCGDRQLDELERAADDLRDRD